MYNEAPNVDRFFERLVPVLERLGLSYEIVCVDDGSRDGTLERLLAHRRRNPAIKVLELARNFGKEIALSAGLEHACGAAVVPIDADLQDPPELIPELVARWREGYEVVYAIRRSRRGESWLKRVTADAFYRVLDRLAEFPVPRNTGDFRLLDRRVVEALRRLPERTRFMKGLFAWVGFRQTAVVYDREPRHAGRTTWSYWRLWNLALEGITSFSSAPLKLASYAGLGLSLLAFFYAAFLVARTLLYGADVPGYASLMVVILFLGGVQLVTLGILGEYLGRVFIEVKGRPLYLIRETYGLEPAGCEAPPERA
ncbi:MAG TPA: glycosyltransferase family 2 protein, partial [Thermodesulfobacteriota bacterium]|nr:glycosyltransferase family 2 protein [Thermodesulfobacteriota bacterium]